MENNNGKTEQEVMNDKAKRIMQGINVWTSFYRANPHRFCVDYLNIHLKPFQQILIIMMNICHYVMYIAARGQGKTFLTAVFCCVRCILYPGTVIRIASGTRRQATETLRKILDILMPNSSNLRAEIDTWQINQSGAFIKFKNTSLIEVVTASDSGRGARANILICDEFRILALEVINTILRKFLTAPRHPGYLDKPEYAHLTERNKEIYLSSAWFKSHWSYEKAKAFCTNLVNDDKKYFICGLPYQLSIRENLLSKEQVADEMSENDFNEMSWSMEMDALFYSDTDGSLFTHEDIAKNRQLKNAILPSAVTNAFPTLKRPKIPPLAKNERRILSADIALLASKKRENDAASLWINSALPTSQGHYVANFIYSDNFEGLHTQDLALIIRRLYEDYHCTDIALDVRGVGIGIYDALVRDIYDPERGVTYSALSCCNDQEYADRCTDPTAPKVIWALKATAQFNNDMYLALREGLKQGRINLLIDEREFDESMRDQKAYESLDMSDKILLQKPYIHTTLLVNELINLEYETRGTVIHVSEKSGMRKDRVSSVGYNYYVMQQIERKYRSDAESFDWGSLVAFRAPQRKHTRRW